MFVQPLKKVGRRLKGEPNDVTMVHHEEGRCLKGSERASEKRLCPGMLVI